MNNKKEKSYDIEKQEKHNLLEQARCYLEQAHDCIQEVFPDDGAVRAYMLDQIKIMVSSDHGFLTNSINIDRLIKKLREE